MGSYSPATIKNYISELRRLFVYYADVRPSQISYQQTLDYLIYLNKTLGCSKTKIKMAAQSFSFFYNHVVKKEYKTPSVLFPAHSSKLPAVLSKQQMMLVFQQVHNLKHQTLLTLLYSTGIRLNEIANLKIEDIDSRVMRIKIVSGKGNKDRFVQLSEMMLQQLRSYYKQYRPELYLFNGYQKGKRYSPRSIQTVLQNALIKAGLKDKNFSIHSIRHSFATHLLDNGTDLHTIKELMGHCNLQQTSRYLHLSTKRIQQITNPLDALFINLQ